MSGEDFEGVVSNMNRLAAMIEEVHRLDCLFLVDIIQVISVMLRRIRQAHTKRIVNTEDQGLILRVRLSDQASTSPVYDTESRTR